MSINANIDNGKGKVIGKSGEKLKITIYGEDRNPVYDIYASKELFEVRYAGDSYEDNLLCLVGDLEGVIGRAIKAKGKCKEKPF